MKKYYRILLLALFAATSLISCEEYLDVSPELGVDSNEVYTDYFSTRQVVDRANRLVHNYVHDRYDWDCEVGTMADEAQTAATNFPTHYIHNTGNWINFGGRELGGMNYLGNDEFVGNAGRLWNSEPVEEAFIGIRSVNNVLQNIDQLTDYPVELGYSAQELKDQLVGQCYFLRAWHYFQIIRRYGGFPIMNEVFPTSTNFDVVRPTYLQSTDSLVADLDKAIQLLPNQWNSQNKGRVTKAAARGLKTMALLYAASPLMNPQLNPYGSSSKEYNLEYAKRAAAAGAEAISTYSQGGYEMLNFDNYTDNWYSRTNPWPKEAIFLPPVSENSSPNTNGVVGVGWFLPQFDGGWKAGNQPTQNAVDWFETADGYDVNDPEAISSGSLDPNDPYANRDPRLRKSIFVHGDDMYGQGAGPSGNIPRIFEAETNGFYYDWEVSKGKFYTGYYHKGKLRWEGCNKYENSTGWYRMFPHIRVAQLYLDFAEAANEAYGPTGAVPGTSLTAVDAINVVRNRANMPNVLAKYTTDKETFKKRIYNERAVELYYEFHRWFDLRRWKLAKEVLGEGIYAADIRIINGETIFGKAKIDGAVRIFEDKHYWYPFPTDVMNMMSVFEQNPGW